MPFGHFTRCLFISLSLSTIKSENSIKILPFLLRDEKVSVVIAAVYYLFSEAKQNVRSEIFRIIVLPLCVVSFLPRNLIDIMPEFWNTDYYMSTSTVSLCNCCWHLLLQFKSASILLMSCRCVSSVALCRLHWLVICIPSHLVIFENLKH